MSTPKEWKQAIRDVYGPVNTLPFAPNATLASASGEGVISYLPALFWGFGYSITAANTMDVRFVDASATAVGTPVKFNIASLAAGTKAVFFDRAIKFDKGLMWVVSATGTATPQLEVFWEPQSGAGHGLI